MDRHFAVAYTAIEQRRRALAADALFGAGHCDSIIQPGIDEVLACRDMLQPAPRQRSRIARLRSHLIGVMRSIAPHKPTHEHRTVRSVPTSTNSNVTRRPAG